MRLLRNAVCAPCTSSHPSSREKRQLEERLNALAAENAHLKSHGATNLNQQEAGHEAHMTAQPRGGGATLVGQWGSMQAAPAAAGDGSMMRMHSVHASATIHHQTFGLPQGRGGGMQPPALALRTPPLPRPSNSSLAYGGGGGGGMGGGAGLYRATTPSMGRAALPSPMPSPQRQRSPMYGGGGQGRGYGRG